MSPNLSKAEREKTFNEVNIIRKCFHANIIAYKDCFIKSSSAAKEMSVLSIVMEFADAGDLHQCIQRRRKEKRNFAEKRVRNYLVQITFALEYLHSRHILHRDLKTQNIFLTSSNRIKLGDFGISKTLSQENDFATTGIGTPQYLSPEICKRLKYDYKSDIWGLGCVLYEMCALEPAFNTLDLPTLIRNIITGKYKPIVAAALGYSESVTDMIRVMLKPDPNMRPSAHQILTAKVLHEDLLDYMKSIKKTINDNEDRKGSSSSLGSSSDGTTALSTLV